MYGYTHCLGDIAEGGKKRFSTAGVFLLLLAFFLSDDGAGTGTVEAFSSIRASSSDQTQVKVSVQRHLPAIAIPKNARTAFLDYVWEKGGGLPIVVLAKKTTTREKTTDNGGGLETTLQRRQLLPILMEEELLEEVEPNDSSTSCQIQYQVKNGGLLSGEIVPDSHLGTVTFETAAQEDEVVVTWDVTFNTTEASRTFLWQAVTERTITDSCNNFQAAMALPKLYKRTTILKSSHHLPKLTPEIAMNKWLKFAWKEGSGLPLPIPPIQVGDARWLVPPFLKEQLLSAITINNDNNSSASKIQHCGAEVQYQVDNPSLFTYQVHSHLGRIRFFSDRNDNNNSGAVRMEWEIEVRPYRGWSAIVQNFTGAVVSCYARNFKCHIQEGPDTMVALKPPRGGSDSAGVLLQIRKDSWVGGVLHTHLKDQRSTVLSQTVALFQPWTWGRSEDYDGEGEGEEWTDGILSK